MTERKQLWMLVGGNGAGKSTFYKHYLEPAVVLFINADNIARTLSPKNYESASYKAARIAEHLRKDLLTKGVSFCFQTVFSHPSKIDFMADAKAQGYEIILVVIHLENDQLNQARVSQRINEGGHSVPTEKIISRIPRTLDNIRRAIPLADEAYLLDNSSLDEPFQQLAIIKQGLINFKIEQLPEWASETLTDYLDE